MPLQNITITSSINSLITQSYGQRTYIASSDNESFPIEQVTGSSAGVWPNFTPGTNYTVGLVVNVTQSWSGSNISTLGAIPFIHDTNEEFINGEFSGSGILVSDGNLTDEDCQQLLEINSTISNYSFFPYETTLIDGIINDTLLPAFLNPYTIPRNGEILFHYNKDFISSPSSTSSFIDYIKISKIDQNGNDNTPSLQSLNKLVWIDSIAGKITLDIINISINPTYFYYQVISNTLTNISFFENDNILDYTLEATSSWTDLNLGYNYLTSSWTSSIDIANGFNTSSGYYIFPLTPNCEIQMTASMDITVNTSCSFSISINGYNPAFPINVSNINSYGFSIPAPLFSSTNTYVLGPGVTHSLVITSSIHDPIQSYIYQINTELGYIGGGSGDYTNDINGNFDYIIGFENPENQYLPSSSYVGSPSAYWYSIIQNNSYLSPVYDDKNTSFGVVHVYSITGDYNSPKALVFFREESVNAFDQSGSILQWRPAGAINPWGTPTQLTIEVTIPSPFTASTILCGPPLIDLTCSFSPSDKPEDPLYILGTIPPNTPGTFTFTTPILNSATTNSINIIFPSGSSKRDNFSEGTGSAISSIRIFTNNITASLHNLLFEITQSQSPQNSTSSILVLEPYLTSDFTYNDCNVLLNNYSQNEISGKVRRVLYDNGGLIPSNIEQIRNNTAEFAEVNDYLYNANSNVLPRYAGVRTTSRNFNLPANNGFNSTELSTLDPNSITSNFDSNVEQTTTYFAYFSEYKSNNPIFKGTTSPIIKYLIREDGETFNPSTDNITYYNLIGSFPVGTKAYSNFLYNASPQFNTTKSILMSGESYIPILYSISASTYDLATWTSTLDFSNLQGSTNLQTVASYSLKIEAPGPGQSSNFISGSGIDAPVSSTPRNLFYYGVYTPDRYYDPENYWSGNYLNANITYPSYSFGGIPQVQVKVEVDMVYYRPNTFYDKRLLVKLWRKNGGDEEVLASYTSRPMRGTSIVNKLTPIDPEPSNCIIRKIFTPQINDTVYVTVEEIGGTGGTIRFYALRISTLGLAVPSIDAPFWFTGSSNSTTLTSSINLGRIIEDGIYLQKDIPGSGFDPIQVPCSIQIGDEIRFEYDENNSYRIIDVSFSQSGADVQTLLTVDRPIPSIPTLDINHFTIRRKIKDAITGIALDGTLYSPISDGYLFPEYPSRTIQSNISNITQDLINKSII